MSDFVVQLDARRVFDIVDRDKDWKKVTPESFMASTADELAIDDPFMLFEPEKLSIRNLMGEWLKDTSEHVRCCSMCDTGLFKLRVTLGKGSQQQRKNTKLTA